MNYDEYHQQIVKELDILIIHYSQEELEKRFFKNFGCINFMPEDKSHELNLAREFHKRHKKLHPKLHDEHEETPYNCYTRTICKCGYCEEVDSSD